MPFFINRLLSYYQKTCQTIKTLIILYLRDNTSASMRANPHKNRANTHTQHIQFYVIFAARHRDFPFHAFSQKQWNRKKERY